MPTLPPGSALPPEEECAARVQRDPWEPRPANAAANRTVPPVPVTSRSWSSVEADELKQRVSGDFVGTTDEILQWASCKWGFDTDVSRAQALAESTWDQAFRGDGGDSKGLFQMKTSVWGGSPYSWTSTAYNADWALGLRRACYEGLMYYGEQTRGDLWGCVGVHFSGKYGSGYDSYLASVQRYTASRPWLSWSSPTGGRPPTPDRR